MINEYGAVAADITLILKAQLQTPFSHSFSGATNNYHKVFIDQSCHSLQYTMYRVKAGSGRSTGATLCYGVTTQTIRLSATQHIM